MRRVHIANSYNDLIDNKFSGEGWLYQICPVIIGESNLVGAAIVELDDGRIIVTRTDCVRTTQPHTYTQQDYRDEFTCPP